MHGSGIPIWFFIGVLLVVYGGMIFGYGIFELATGSYPVGVQLTNLAHPCVVGRILFSIGLLYVVKFRPGRTR